jgi:hypothetical protein
MARCLGILYTFLTTVAAAADEMQCERRKMNFEIVCG